jgi:hypothetical protein
MRNSMGQGKKIMSRLKMLKANWSNPNKNRNENINTNNTIKENKKNNENELIYLYKNRM